VLEDGNVDGVSLPRQVGVNDFHLANIGDVNTASFHADTQRKRVYFSTVSDNIRLQLATCDRGTSCIATVACARYIADGTLLSVWRC